MENAACPLISVVIPTCRRLELLMNRSLPSALGQWYDNFEVVVVVDGPDPDTAHALNALAAQDSRVRPVFLPCNMGGSDARNAGIQAARGDWIAFLDDDDEMLPHNLMQHLEAVTQTSLEAGVQFPVSVCSFVTRTPQSDTVRPPRMPDEGEPLGDYILARRSLRERECGFTTSTIFAGRDLLLAYPFRSGLTRLQDCDWVLRVSMLPEVKFRFSRQIAIIWYFDSSRKQVSHSLHWPESLAWILESRERGLVSYRAVAGFINGTLADYAKLHGQYRALLPLTRTMLASKPRAFEWLRFGMIWSTPNWLRSATRTLRHRESRGNAPASPTIPSSEPETPPSASPSTLSSAVASSPVTHPIAVSQTQRTSKTGSAGS